MGFGLREYVLTCLPCNICYINLPENNEQLPPEKQTTARLVERPRFCCAPLRGCVGTKAILPFRTEVKSQRIVAYELARCRVRSVRGQFHKMLEIDLLYYKVLEAGK